MMTALRLLLSLSEKPKSEAAKVWELSSLMVMVLSMPAGALFGAASVVKLSVVLSLIPAKSLLALSFRTPLAIST